MTGGKALDSILLAETEESVIDNPESREGPSVSSSLKGQDHYHFALAG